MGIEEWLGLKPSMDEFARRLLGSVKQTDPKRIWSYDRTELTINDGSGGQINLQNIYLEYSNASRSLRPSLLSKYSSMGKALSQSVPKLWSLASQNIYAVIRSRYDQTYVNLLAQHEGRTFPKIMSRALVDPLEIRIGYDWGDRITTVSEEVADAWGQPADVVFATAIQNLGSLKKPVWEELGPGTLQLCAEDSYEESRLLVEKVTRPVFDSFPAPVFLPINRGMLLAADSRSPTAVMAMLDHAERCFLEKPWPLGVTPVIREVEHWERYVGNDAIAQRLHDLSRIDIASTYKEQKAAMDKFNKERGRDVFVATFGLARRDETGPIESWCSWAQGVQSWLPRADTIVMSRNENAKESDRLALPWNTVLKICRERLVRLPDDPERYSVDSFPTDTEWTALKQEQKKLFATDGTVDQRQPEGSN